MENRSHDKITRDMIACSHMEITNVHFNDIIIHKLKERKRRRNVINYFISCVLLIIVSAVLVIFSIPAQQPVTGNVATRLNIFGNDLLNFASTTTNWFTDNVYFIIPVIVLFFCKKVIDLKFMQRAHLMF